MGCPDRRLGKLGRINLRGSPACRVLQSLGDSSGFSWCPYRAHDLDTSAPVLLGIDLSGPHVLAAQDDPGGLDAEPLPDLGRCGMAELMRVPLRDACLAARKLDRSSVTRDPQVLWPVMAVARDSANGHGRSLLGAQGITGNAYFGLGSRTLQRGEAS